MSDLPGLGVCYQGKVALRKDAGIGVARHELAHALGGDEAAAQKASTDSSVLTSLSGTGGSSVDGWAIGFEFQTAGANNPKVYRCQPDGQPDGNEIDTKLGVQKFDGWKMETDKMDMEVITSPVEETHQGRQRLRKVMENISEEMENIQDNGANLDIQDDHLNVANYPRNQPNYAVLHSSAGNFNGRPQATVGVHFAAVPDLINELSKQRKSRGGWAKGQLGWEGTHGNFKDQASNHGQTHITQVQGNVDAAIGKHGKPETYPRLRALLNVLAGYAAISKIQKASTSNAKNVAAYMSRGNLTEIYKSLRPEAVKIYEAMINLKEGSGSMAQAFGCATQDELDELPFLPQGLSDKDEDLTYGKILRNLPKEDLIAAMGEDAIHSAKSIEGTRWDFDIGQSDKELKNQKLVEEKFRTGMFLELRALRFDVPWDEWPTIATTAFDYIRSLNSKYEV